jgi:uncharacterized HAD superfamily protein
MSLARIGIDLDGVAHCFVGGIHRYLRAIEHPGTPAEIVGTEVAGFGFYKPWGIDDQEFDQIHDEATEQGFAYSGDLLDEAASWVRMLHSLGHSIHIVTSRPRAAIGFTSEWLDLHNFPFDSLTFSSDKTVVRTDAYVEDQVKHYQSLEASESVPFLVTRGWNRETPGNFFRVDDIGQFARMVAGREAEDIRAEREEWVERSRRLHVVSA